MSGTEPNGVDTVLEALADDRRRCALRCLRRHEELTLPDLAEEVTVSEEEAPLPELSAERVSETYFSLYHTHVPKLQEADFVDYSQERDLVQCGDALDEGLLAAREELDGLLDVPGDPGE